MKYLKKFENLNNVNGIPVSKFTWSKPFITISYEFESESKPKSNDWQVNQWEKRGFEPPKV